MGTHKKLRQILGKTSLAILCGSIALMISPRFVCAQESATSTEKPADIVLPPFPPLSYKLPYDVNVEEVRSLIKKGEILQAHRLFDTLSWQAFVALNWPAGKDGEPDEMKTIADTTGPRVWDFYRPSDTIFLPNGEKPKKWSGDIYQEAELKTKAAWRQHTTQSGNLEAFSGPLVDQHGNWARYEIRVNHEEFDYIFENELYSQDGQVRFSQRPENNEVSLPLNEGQKKHGAIEIKLAWKELDEKLDDASRFYVTELVADLSEPPKPGETKPPQRKFKAGLVGMHISMRTESSPEWIWATFEQVDNVRVNYNKDGKPIHPNFSNPEKPQPINVLPPANAIVNPNTGALEIVTDTSTVPNKWVESLTTTPVQTARVVVPTQGTLNPLDATLGKVTAAINEQVQALLKQQGSAFQYYELIDTQWPVHPNAPAFAGGNDSAPESITHKTPGDMIPVFLVNTTMETYFQKGPQPAGPLEQDDRLAAGSPPIDNTPVFGTESCVGCHYSSGITIGFKKDADGKELLVNGVPQPIFGENNHFGKTGNASFSWMLQLEPTAEPRKTPAAAESELPAAKKEALKKFLEMSPVTRPDNKSAEHPGRVPAGEAAKQ